MKPRRVQLRRTKGWRMPPNTVKADRSTILGNPFHNRKLPRAKLVRLHRHWLKHGITKRAVERIVGQKVTRHNPMTWFTLALHRSIVRGRLSELRGVNMACWCPPREPCHVDTLIELANA